MEKMDKARQELENLPISFSDEPQTKLLGVCNDFVSELSEYVNGATSRQDFLKELMRICRNLSCEIKKTKPYFEIPSKSHAPGIPTETTVPESKTAKGGTWFSHQVIC